MPNLGSSPPLAQLDYLSRTPVDRIVYYDTSTHCYVMGFNPDRALYHVLTIKKYDPEADVSAHGEDDSQDDHQGMPSSPVELDVRSTTCVLTEAQALIDALQRDYALDVQYGRLKAIMGWVRFTQGYYLVGVTKRKLVARFGIHRIFEVEDTVMLPLTVDPSRLAQQRKRQTHAAGVRSSRGGISSWFPAASFLFDRRTPEDHYREQFASVSLKQTFYYSHTYDLSNTLQTNMTVPEGNRERRMKYIWNTFVLEPLETEECHLRGSMSEADLASSVDSSTPLSDTHRSPLLPDSFASSVGDKRPGFAGERGMTFPPELHASLWIVYFIRGAVTQQMVRLSGTGRPSLLLTLIARVSKEFTGARYLRRGVNVDGHVANHVEVEQILCDESTLQHHYSQGNFSSYVQVRGSVPVRWYHPAAAAMPKPAIVLDRDSPFLDGTCQHFQELVADYGLPVVVMDYLKSHERQPRETVLGNAYRNAVNILAAAVARNAAAVTSTPSRAVPLVKDPSNHSNGATPLQPRDVLRYTAIDLRRVADQAWNVVTAAAAADEADIDFFACRADGSISHIQCGVVRSNCVDCIDRTNIGQFIFSLHLLGRQLAAIGMLQSAADLVHSPGVQELLLRMYLFLGDAIATQYGGSAQLGAGVLHRGPGWDQVMGIKRFYNNVMGDRDKQSALNLFLGRFQPAPRPFSRACNAQMHPKALRHLASEAGDPTAATPPGRGSRPQSNAEAAVATTPPRHAGAETVHPPRDVVTAMALSPLSPSVASTRHTQSVTTSFWRRGTSTHGGDGVEVDADYYLQVKGGPTLPDPTLLLTWWAAPLAWHQLGGTTRSPHYLHCNRDGSERGHFLRESPSASHSSSFFRAEDECSGVPCHHRDEGEAEGGGDADAHRSQEHWMSGVALQERTRCVDPVVHDVTPQTLPRSSGGTERHCLNLADTMVQQWPSVADAVGRAQMPVLHHISDTPGVEAGSAYTTLPRNARRWPAPAQERQRAHVGTGCGESARGHADWDQHAEGRALLQSLCGVETSIDDVNAGACDETGPGIRQGRLGSPWVVEECIHDHKAFPAEVYNSLYAIQQRHREQMGDRVVSCQKEDVTEEVCMTGHTLNTTFGALSSWTTDTLLDALCYLHPELSPQERLSVRQTQLTGIRLLQLSRAKMAFAQTPSLLPQYLCTALERILTAFAAVSGPTTTARHHTGPTTSISPSKHLRSAQPCMNATPSPASPLLSPLYNNGVTDSRQQHGSPSQCLSKRDECLAAQRTAAQSTCALLQPFFFDDLTPENLGCVIFQLFAAMMAPHNGVPLRHHVRYTDEVRKGPTGHNRIPVGVVVRDAFSVVCLHRWLMTHGARGGLRLQAAAGSSPGIASPEEAASQLIIWMVGEGLVIPALEGSLDGVYASHANRQQRLEYLRDPTALFLLANRGAMPLSLLNLPKTANRDPTAVCLTLTDTPPTVLAESLASFALSSVTSVLRIPLSDVDAYKSAARCILNGLEGSVAALSRADMHSVPHTERLCFFMNVYNTLYVHAWVTTSLGGGVPSAAHFYDTNGYAVGSYAFSLRDLKDGLLGSNGLYSSGTGRSVVEFPVFAAPNDPRAKLLPPQLCTDWRTDILEAALRRVASDQVIRRATKQQGDVRCSDAHQHATGEKEMERMSPLVGRMMLRKPVENVNATKGVGDDPVQTLRSLWNDAHRYMPQRVILALMDTYLSPPLIIAPPPSSASAPSFVSPSSVPVPGTPTAPWVPAVANPTGPLNGNVKSAVSAGAAAARPAMLSPAQLVSSAVDTCLGTAATGTSSLSNITWTSLWPSERQSPLRPPTTMSYWPQQRGATPCVHLCQPLLSHTYPRQLQQIEAGFLSTLQRAEKSRQAEALVRSLRDFESLVGRTVVEVMHTLQQSQESAMHAEYVSSDQ